MILGSHGKVWAPGGQGVMNDTEAGGPILYYHYGE
jgi:arabinan endo-1,5-alpha-L-arabinosidase